MSRFDLKRILIGNDPPDIGGHKSDIPASKTLNAKTTIFQVTLALSFFHFTMALKETSREFLNLHINKRKEDKDRG